MKRIALPTCLLLVVMLASFAVLRARAQDEPTQPIPADNQPIPILSDALQSPDPDVLAPVSQTDPLLIDPQPLDQPRLNALPVPGLPAAVLAPLPEDEPVPIGAPILAPPGALVLPGALAPPVLQSADLVPSQILPPGPSAPTVATDPFAAPAHDDRRLPFVQIYQLKYMPAQDAAGTLQQLFPDRDLNFVADERTNSIVVRGHEDDFKQISELLKELDSADAVVPKKTLIKRNRSDDERLLERRVLELKSKLDEETARSTGRKTKDTDTRLQELAQQLRGAVDEAFNERQRQQLAEIEELTVRLSKLAKVVREREAQREAIIEERLSQLTGGKQSDLRKEPVVRSEGASEEGLFVDDFPGVSLLLFTAANSPPSREMERNLASLQKDGIHVETIDVSVTPEIGLRFGVESIPTVILKNHGQVVKKIVGTTTEYGLRVLVNRESEPLKQSSHEKDIVASGRKPEDAYDIMPIENALITVRVGSGKILRHSVGIRQILGFDKDLVTVQTGRTANDITVFGLKRGVTDINWIDENGQRFSNEIDVTGDTRELETLIRRAFPEEEIILDEVGETAIRLSGSVSSAGVFSRIEEIASQFYPSVLNHLEVRRAAILDGSINVSDGNATIVANAHALRKSMARVLEDIDSLQQKRASFEAIPGTPMDAHAALKQDLARATHLLQQQREECATYLQLLGIEHEAAKAEYVRTMQEQERVQLLAEKGVVPSQEVAAAEAVHAEAVADTQRLAVLLKLFRDIEQSATLKDSESAAEAKKSNDLVPDGNQDPFKLPDDSAADVQAQPGEE